MKERIKLCFFYFLNINIHDYVKHHLNRFRIAKYFRASTFTAAWKDFLKTKLIRNNL
jgi:hypothetical protein